MKSFRNTYSRICLGFFVVTLANLAISARSQITNAAFFPLMAWDDVQDEATVQKMAECGINAIAFVPTNMLAACERHNVKAIVYDPLITPSWNKPFDSKSANEELPKLIKAVNGSSAVWGYHLRDEPDAGQFTDLGKSAALVRQLAPGKWPYINLLPGAGDSYCTNYINAFLKTCLPQIISYDNYPISENGGFSSGFWANISDVRNAAVRNNISFYTIILTAAHFNYRVPTADDLRLQVYGSLVYGAKGIAYYKFCSKPLSVMGAPDLGNFRMAPLDEFGEKTLTWDYLRNINRQVKNLSSILLKLHSDDVYHVGDIPERNHGITTNSLVKGMESQGQFIIGDFTHEDGSRWIMIVNKDLKNSVFCRPVLRKEYHNIQYVSPSTGEIASFPNSLYALAPGQGVLLKIE